ncbi:MAG TPA: recombinase family protein [Acidimicrobiales bacterium]|nr:recombinase family protein [Acidimicrobiales bacterium]
MARRPKQAADPTRVVGYCRCSTQEQSDSGLGLDAQRASILAECARKGWTLVEMVEDAGFSAKSLDRPGMGHVLDLLRSGQAGALVVAKLDRATRSVMDAGNLLAQGQREGWTLVALDLGLDPSTPTGELVANLMASVAQWERRAIGVRTRDALAAKKAAGVRLGRPVLLPAAVAQRIAVAKEAGESLSAIARALNADGVPTAHGGSQWHASTVRAVLGRQAANANA